MALSRSINSATWGANYLNRRLRVDLTQITIEVGIIFIQQVVQSLEISIKFIRILSPGKRSSGPNGVVFLAWMTSLKVSVALVYCTTSIETPFAPL